MKKNWTIDEIKAIINNRKENENELYCVALEWDGAGNYGTEECGYFTTPEDADIYIKELHRRGGVLYKDSEKLSVYVQKYAALIADLHLDEVTDDETDEDYDFAINDGCVVLTHKWDIGGQEICEYVCETEPEKEEKALDQEDVPYNVKAYIKGKKSDYNVDNLTWMWQGRKFEAYGKLRTIKVVRLNQHYEGETGELPGVGIDWTAPDDKRHEIFIADVDENCTIY